MEKSLRVLNISMLIFEKMEMLMPWFDHNTFVYKYQIIILHLINKYKYCIKSKLFKDEQIMGMLSTAWAVIDEY